MRMIFLSMVLMLVVSCGKDGGGSGNVVQRQESTADLMWDGQGKELKEAVIDVPASVSDSQIVFSKAATNTDGGSRVKCTVFVNAQETYSYSVSGNRLYLQTNHGNYDLVKVNSFPAGNPYGVWSSVSKTDDGRFEFKVSIFPTHVMIRKNCEG